MVTMSVNEKLLILSEKVNKNYYNITIELLITAWKVAWKEDFGKSR